MTGSAVVLHSISSLISYFASFVLQSSQSLRAASQKLSTCGASKAFRYIATIVARRSGESRQAYENDACELLLLITWLLMLEFHHDVDGRDYLSRPIDSLFSHKLNSQPTVDMSEEESKAAVLPKAGMY